MPTLDLAASTINNPLLPQLPSSPHDDLPMPQPLHITHGTPPSSTAQHLRPPPTTVANRAHTHSQPLNDRLPTRPHTKTTRPHTKTAAHVRKRHAHERKRRRPPTYDKNTRIRRRPPTYENNRTTNGICRSSLI
ncbi:hypothetical protein K443DRAFT_12492 [Laccaria amethystina LaAM-08-1]|uniref:Uncharacterized protein n=1 Tax=Laccaria amethystina LaAM-08-1 TaxID=1095629 RepID=A0A0C9WYE2_9AGAR|nr:hypothetical protein K443DRAFT_12492 [Laccaria amethystina LaAM-08-1]